MNIFVWIICLFALHISTEAQSSVIEGAANIIVAILPKDEDAWLNEEEPGDLEDVINYVELFQLLAESEKEPIEKIDDLSKNMEEFHRLHINYGHFVNRMLNKNGSQTPDEEMARKAILMDILGKFEKQENDLFDRPRRLQLWSYSEQISRPLQFLMIKIDQVMRSPVPLREQATDSLKNQCRRNLLEKVITRFELLFRDSCPMPTIATIDSYSKYEAYGNKTKNSRGMDSYSEAEDAFHDNKTESERTHCAIATLFKDVNNRLSLANPALDELFMDMLRTSFAIGTCESVLETSLDSLQNRLNNVMSHVVQWTRSFQTMAWPVLGESYSKANLRQMFNGTSIDISSFNRTAKVIADEFEDRGLNGYQYQVVITPHVPQLSSEMISVVESLEESNHFVFTILKMNVHVFKFPSDSISRKYNMTVSLENLRSRIEHRHKQGSISPNHWALSLDCYNILKNSGFHGILVLRNKEVNGTDAGIHYGISFKKLNATLSVTMYSHNHKFSDPVNSIIFQFL